MRTKIVITGGAGFIGSHLAAGWAARGAQVVVVDSLRTGHRTNLDGIDCEFIQADIRDGAALEAAMRGAWAVHHLAAMVSVPESIADPVQAESINLAGTRTVLEAARKAGVGKVVYSSTCAIYGEAQREAHREDHLPEPITPYAVTKLAGEHYCQMFSALHGLPTAVLRYFNVYGPRQDPKSPYAAVVAIFAERARAGKPLRIHGDGSQTRDFVFVEDVVAANILAAEKGTGTYNVGTGQTATVLELAESIRELCGSSSAIEHGPERPGDIRHSRACADRLHGLGWKQGVALLEGLRKTLGEGGSVNCEV